MKFALLTALLAALLGCATESKGWRMPDNDGGSKAQGEAFTADGMHFRKDMPKREKQAPQFDFYYKHCSMNGDESYYSKTSYDCSSPF